METLARGFFPLRIVSLPHPRHVVGLVGCDELREYSPLGKASCQFGDDGKNALHPWSRPWALRGKYALHVDAKMHGFGRERILVEVFGQHRAPVDGLSIWDARSLGLLPR